MIFGWESVDNGGLGLVPFIISVAIILIAYCFALFIVFKISHKTIALVNIFICFVLALVSITLKLDYLFIFNCFLSCCMFLITCIANLANVRALFAVRKNAKKNVTNVDRIFDRKAMYKQIEVAVSNLSKSKTGALITFEKTSSLDDVIKNGVAIHAPVKSELLTTIFYPGTRLHDGAVVIRGNEILAASVFYTPTTKAFGKKYGSRHRAAIGISESSDAITIIVSEETGRISFAVGGELESVELPNFLKTFETYMGFEEKADD